MDDPTRHLEGWYRGGVNSPLRLPRKLESDLGWEARRFGLARTERRIHAHEDP
jgi:hypothetical protein